MLKNILILSTVYSPNIGGAETHLTDYTNFLLKKGHRVTVFTYQPITTKAKGKYIERDKNLLIIRFPWFGHNLFHKLEPYPPLLFLYTFTGLFIGSMLCFPFLRGITTIHAQGFVSGVIGLILKKLYRKKLLISLHALFFPLYRLTVKVKNPKKFSLHFIFSFILKRADYVVCFADKSKEEVLTLGVPEEKIIRCDHWVDTNRFRRHTYRYEFNPYTVLFVGRPIKKKGGYLIRQLTLPKDIDIEFATDISAIYMPLKYNHADVVVVPSLYEELFGRVVIEALACGVPVIVSNRGTLPSLINVNVGLVVEPTVETLQQAILHIYNHPLDYTWDNCRRHVLEHYTEKNAEVINKIL